jgi:hypothetical protein
VSQALRGLAWAARWAEGLLLEPADPSPARGQSDLTVAVVALGPGCGCTTVARALMRLTGGWLLIAGTDDLERADSLEPPGVIEVPHAEPPAVAASLADTLLLVAGPAVEPTLAAAAARSLARVSRCPPEVAAWGVDPAAWEGVADADLPAAPGEARLIRAGIPVRGALSRALEPLISRGGPCL